MTKVLVDAEALKRVLNYMMDDEHRDYLECKETWDWDYEQLKHHIYMSLERLEIDFLKGQTMPGFDHNPLDNFPTIWSKT
jgi:hypothetical protein